ncbi:MAG: hypothetical protein CL610_25535 [Anaerolineaceae bacterium]|nr:hypothetical protein [Anaerolineaceae bacterium]
MKNFLSNPRQFIDRIVLGVVLVFAVVVVLLASSLLRQAQLQQTFNNTSLELRENLEEMQSTTEELQETINLLQADAVGEEIAALELEAIDQQVEELEEQLDEIEQALADVEPILSEETAIDPPAFVADTQDVETLQTEINWLFRLSAWIIGAASVIIALIAYLVLNPRFGNRRRRPRPSPGWSSRND